RPIRRANRSRSARFVADMARSPGSRKPLVIRRQGFTPCSWAELDGDLSGDALQLLLWVRRSADRDETDGRIGLRSLKALAIEHGISVRKLRKSCAELIETGRLTTEPDGFCDANFLNVCRSATQREIRRGQWRKATGTQRADL